MIDVIVRLFGDDYECVELEYQSTRYKSILKTILFCEKNYFAALFRSPDDRLFFCAKAKTMEHVIDYYYWLPIFTFSFVVGMNGGRCHDEEPMNNWFALSDEEHKKFLKRDFPIRDMYGVLFWLDENNFFHRDGNNPSVIWTDGIEDYYIHGKLHRTDGVAFERNGGKMYFIDGVELSEVDFVKATRKRFYFLREKINCLQKLIEIPELFQEVYYSRKKDFMELLKKI